MQAAVHGWMRLPRQCMRKSPVYSISYPAPCPNMSYTVRFGETLIQSYSALHLDLLSQGANYLHDFTSFLLCAQADYDRASNTWSGCGLEAATIYCQKMVSRAFFQLINMCHVSSQRARLLDTCPHDLSRVSCCSTSSSSFHDRPPPKIPCPTGYLAH